MNGLPLFMGGGLVGGDSTIAPVKLTLLERIARAKQQQAAYDSSVASGKPIPINQDLKKATIEAISKGQKIGMDDSTRAAAAAKFNRAEWLSRVNDEGFELVKKKQ